MMTVLLYTENQDLSSAKEVFFITTAYLPEAPLSPLPAHPMTSRKETWCSTPPTPRIRTRRLRWGITQISK